MLISLQVSDRLDGQLKIRGIPSAGMDDVLATIDTGVFAESGHHRSDQVSGTDNEAELLAGMEGEANRQQIEFDVNDLAGREFLHAVEAMGRYVIGRQLFVEVPSRYPQPAVRTFVAQDARPMIRDVVGPRALVGDSELL